ncbi:unnamed protein product [Cunninghamella echinulata]
MNNNNSNNNIDNPKIIKNKSQQNNETTTADILNNVLNSKWWVISKQDLNTYKNINECFQSIYHSYIIRGYAIRDRCLSAPYPLPEKPKFKFYCLKRFFTWWASLTVSLLIKRTSRCKLETYTVPSLALYMFQMNDAQHNIKNFIPANEFFSLHEKNYHHHSIKQQQQQQHPLQSEQEQEQNEKNKNKMNSPLQSLPPEQAMSFIDTFFCVHPFSILINKTKLIQDYWSDTATPLLLSVIYGTTLCFHQHAQGLPVGLWESNNEDNRNPFLNYAYVLLKESAIVPNADNYRAIVILALFENLWGYSKLGMSLLSTSYIIGTQLGLWENSYKSNDPVEEELVNMTFWAAFRTTTHGCIELGCNIVDSLINHRRPFPPTNIADSLSFLYDQSHNNVKSANQISYIYETYYAGAVISYYSGILFACLPKPPINIFGLPTSPCVFTGSPLLTSLRDVEDLETRLFIILDDFGNFIQQQKYQWSSIQLYTIHMTHLLYRIQFRFLRFYLTSGKVKEQEDLIPDATEPPINYTCIDVNDTDTIRRLQKVLPDLLTLVDDLENILIGDTIIKTVQHRIFLPGEVIVASFETCVQLLMMNYQAQPTKAVHDALIKLSIVSNKRDEYRAAKIALKNISQRLHIFLKRHHHQSYVRLKSFPPPPRPQSIYDDNDSDNNNDHSSSFFTLSSSTVLSSEFHLCHTNPPLPPSALPPSLESYHNNHTSPSSASSLSSSSSSTSHIISSTSSTDYLSYDHPDNTFTNSIDNDDHYDLFGMEDSNFIDWNNLTTNIFNPYEGQDQGYHVC